MYIHKNTSQLWFRRKRYGWGWTPSTWQGWLSVAVFIFLVTVLSLRVDEYSTDSFVMMQFILPVVVLVIAFMVLAYIKGESPKWQWGGEK
jgi:hypothetical protein